jgi:hypothetical protein
MAAERDYQSLAVSPQAFMFEARRKHDRTRRKAMAKCKNQAKRRPGGRKNRTRMNADLPDFRGYPSFA